MENTSSVAIIAPANADKSTSVAPSPSIIASNAATAAPPELPSMYGSASGLRSNTCIRTPATASRPPTPNAVNARGRRKSMTTLRAWSAAFPASACQISAVLISALPDTSANSPANSDSIASMGKSRLGRTCAKKWLLSLAFGRIDQRRQHCR
jgi:hypothetical protein